MTTLVVNTNIAFSALLSKNSALGNFLLTAKSKHGIRLIAPEYLATELSTHFLKAVRLSGLSTLECGLRMQSILSTIDLISEQNIPVSIFAKAAELLRNIDLDDVAFVATSIMYDVPLLTGDKVLYTGLNAKGYTNVLSFHDLRVKLRIV